MAHLVQHVPSLQGRQMTMWAVRMQSGVVLVRHLFDNRPLGGDACDGACHIDRRLVGWQCI